MSEWKELKIEDFCEVIGGGTPSTKEDSYYAGDISWITPRDLTNYKNRFISRGERNISDLGLKNSSAKILPKNSILLTSRAPIGYLAIAENEVCTNQGFKSLIVDAAKADYNFVYYLIKSNVERIKGLGTGTTFAEISGSVVKGLKFTIPDLPTQTAIAEILSSLDDKIELNNKINQELETLAQTLFKQWFIDFEFPNENGEPYKSSGGEMVESELGEIPKGWEVKTFADIAQVIDCLHSKKPIIFNDSTGYLFLQLSNIKDDGLLDLTQKFWISKEDYQKWISRIEVKEGDFVITNVGRSGAVSRIGKGVKAAIGRNMTALRLKDNFQFNGFFSVLILSDFMKKEITSKLDSGTILDALNVKSIPKLRFTFPIKLELPIEFETFVRPIWDRMETNLIENKSLIDTRDYLLPKLISGELEINELPN
jgi:type I restriction enzyme S subunit